jgi:atypical dual specificity phosphatase
LWYFHPASRIERRSTLSPAGLSTRPLPYNFSWLVRNRLAASGRPGSALERKGEMLPHEQRFLNWLNTSTRLALGRESLLKEVGLSERGEKGERRLLEMYRKFRDVFGILKGFREGFGPSGEPVDRFVRNLDLEGEDLRFLRDQGVRSIVTLTERELDPDQVRTAGLPVLHLPVVDRAAPSTEQVDALMAYLDRELGAERPVNIHCLGGYGRTGTMLACYLVHCGAAAAEAIAEVRRARPGSIETDVQEEAVRQREGRKP